MRLALISDIHGNAVALEALESGMPHAEWWAGDWG